MMRSKHLITLGCALAMATACGAPKTKEPGVAEATKQAPACRGSDTPVSAEILDALALPATDHPRAGAGDKTVKEADLDRYIASLVDDDRFASEVAPHMLVENLLRLAGTTEYPISLAVDDSSGKPLHYLPRIGKCKPTEAVDVHPWWALDTTIKVCPQSYQPTHLKVEQPGFSLFCGAVMNPYCGCGPNLAFCARDEKLKQDVLTSMRQEASLIVARTVKTDARLEQMWLTNETERDRTAEFIYRRWRISAGESPSILDDLKDWPATPTLKPRYEASKRQHSGLLTSAGALGMESSVRARMKWFYQALWCDEPPGGTVSTEAVLALKGNDLRNGVGWEQLAAKPLCTDCHARLDYGGQFFSGYGVLFAYDPKDHVAGKGKLFAANIDDYRGTADLDPRSFAELATAQPEYSACVVKNVKRRVFEDAWDTTSDEALNNAFRDRHSLKAVMRVALRAYADRRLAGTSCNDSQGPKPVKPVDTLEASLAANCRTCHGPKRAPDFAQLGERSTLLRALDAVAFGRMPRRPMTLTAQERRRMVELLIERLWTDEKARAEARAYFEDARPLPVHGVQGLLNAVDARAGAHGVKTPLHEELDEIAEAATRGDLLRYQPGVESIISLEALAACKQAGKSGSELEACIAKATDLNGTLRSKPSK